MTDLHDLLERRAAQFHPEPMPDAFDRAMRRAARRQRNRRIGAALLAFAMFAGAGTGLWIAFQPGTPRHAPQPAEIPVPGTTSTYALPSAPSGVAVASDGTVWATLPDALAKIDPATGRVDEEFTNIFSTKPGDLTGIAFEQFRPDWQIAWLSDSGGYVWSVTVVAPLDIPGVPTFPSNPVDVGGSAMGIAVGDGSVWATVVHEGPGELVRIDPRTDEVTGRSPTGDGPGSVTVGQGGVWVEVTSGDARLERFDPTGSELVGEQGGGWHVAATADEAWASGSDTVQRLMPTTTAAEPGLSPGPSGGLPSPSSEPSAHVPGAGALTIDGNQVWALALPNPDHDGLLYEIDRNNGEIIGTPMPVGMTPVAVAVGGGSVWVANYADPSITRVQLLCSGSPCTGSRTNSIPTPAHVSTISLPDKASDVAVAPDGTLWATLPNALARIDPATGAVSVGDASVFAGHPGHLTGIAIVDTPVRHSESNLVTDRHRRRSTTTPSIAPTTGGQGWGFSHPPVPFFVGNHLVGAGFEATVAAVPDGQEVGTLSPEATFLPDGRMLYLAWDPRIHATEIHMFDPRTGDDSVQLTGGSSVAARNDGAIAYSIGHTDLHTQPLLPSPTASPGTMSGIDVTPDARFDSSVSWVFGPGAYVAVGWAGSTLLADHQNDAGTWDVLAVDGPNQVRVLAPSASVVAISPEGSRVLVSERSMPPTRPIAALAVVDVSTARTITVAPLPSLIDPASGDAIGLVEGPGDWVGDRAIVQGGQGSVYLRVETSSIAVEQVVVVDGFPALREPQFIDGNARRIIGWTGVVADSSGVRFSWMEMDLSGDGNASVQLGPQGHETIRPIRSLSRPAAAGAPS